LQVGNVIAKIVGTKILKTVYGNNQLSCH